MNEPPSIPLPPMGVRYPLYADEVAAAAAEPEDTLLFAPLPPSDPHSAPAPARPRRTAGGVAVAGALVLLVVMALIGWRLLGVSHARAHASTPTTSPHQALALSASAPITAPPGVDTAGQAVTYAAANMVDGKATTAWRMPGDGTGTTLTFTLARPATITSVGLINGYAKTEDGMDWYAGNRRILKVSWQFDGGRTVTQTLHTSRSLQHVSVPRVRSSSVRLTLLAVSPPGKGRASRDMTAISEVQVDG